MTEAAANAAASTGREVCERKSRIGLTFGLYGSGLVAVFYSTPFLLVNVLPFLKCLVVETAMRLQHLLHRLHLLVMRIEFVFERAFEEGRGLTLEEAVERALRV